MLLKYSRAASIAEQLRMLLKYNRANIICPQIRVPILGLGHTPNPGTTAARVYLVTRVCPELHPRPGIPGTPDVPKARCTLTSRGPGNSDFLDATGAPNNRVHLGTWVRPGPRAPGTRVYPNTWYIRPQAYPGLREYPGPQMYQGLGCTRAAGFARGPGKLRNCEVHPGPGRAHRNLGYPTTGYFQNLGYTRHTLKYREYPGLLA